MREIFDQIRTEPDFDDFLEWVDGKYEILKEEDATGQAIKKRGLLTFYNIYNNAVRRDSRYELVINNIDPLYPMDDYEKQIGLSVLDDNGNKRFPRVARKLDYDLKNKNKLGEYVPQNFLEASDAEIRGVKINTPNSGLIGYFNLSQSGTVIPYNITKNSDGKPIAADWFFKPLGLDITDKQLSSWEYQLISMTTKKDNPIPMVLVMPTPGDSATFMTTRILNTQINEMFPKEAVLEALKESNPNYYKEVSELGEGESILKWFQSKQSMYETTERNVKTKDDTGVTLAEKKYGPDWKTRWDKHSKSFLQLQNIIYEIGKKNWTDYVNNQFAKGLITKEQRKMMIDSADLKLRAKTKSNKSGTAYRRSTAVGHISSLVARHEWLQAVRGDDYMLHENGNLYHVGTRLKLNKSMGAVAEGSGDSRRLLYDQNRVRVEYTNPETGETKEIEHIADVLGGTNRNDGASFYSTQRLEILNNNMGTYPIEDKKGEFWPKEIKTVVSERFEDDQGNWTGYFELKHAGFEMPAGIKVFDLNGNLLFETRQEMDKVKIYNINGESIDAVHDLDAAKTRSGKLLDVQRKNKNDKYIKTAVTFWTKEQSERMISTPKYSFNKTVFGLMSYMKELNHTFKNQADQQAFDAFKNAFVGMSKDQSTIYIDALVGAEQDPNKMRSLLDYVYENMVGKNDSFRDKLDNARGMGIHHPDFLNQARAILTNMLLGRGMMKLHTHTDNIVPADEFIDDRIYGSDYVMAPDFTDEVKDTDHVILSADNKVIYDQIILKAKLNHDIEIKSIKEMNEFLEKHPQKVLTYRPPITHISAVQSKRIQKFAEGAGNGIYHHPEDVFVRMTGDHDIDHAGAILLPEKYAEPIEAFQKTKWYENMASINANLDMFEVEQNVNLADLNAVKEGWLLTIKGVGIQGQAMNMKSLVSTLSTRFNSITFSDNTKIRPKKPTDIVVMDYAPLDYKKAKEMEKNGELPFGASIQFDEASGNYYLKTTVAHELLLIANAATDYANKKLRGMMMNQWGLNHRNWFIDRMYHIDKGNLRQPHYNILRDLHRKYNYSTLKQLRTPKARRKMNFGLVFKNLQTIKNDLYLTADQQVEQLLPMLEFLDASGNVYLKVDGIDMNKVITPEESILINPIEYVNDFYDDPEGKVHPLFYPKERYEIAHHLTKNTLKTKYFLDKGKWDAEQVQEAYRLAVKYAGEEGKFYEINEKMSKLSNQDSLNENDLNAVEEFVKTKKPEYDEELFNFNQEFIQELYGSMDVYGDAVRDIFTLYVISGLDFRLNVNYLPVLKVGNQFLMSPEIHREYMELWEQNFFDPDKRQQWENSIKSLKDKGKTLTFNQWLQYQDEQQRGIC